MTLTLHLTPETENRLRQWASQAGKNPETVALEALNEKLAEADSQPSHTVGNDAEWTEKLHACIALHPTATNPLDDSRESIYAGRGE
jgi:hypothetical protein